MKRRQRGEETARAPTVEKVMKPEGGRSIIKRQAAVMSQNQKVLSVNTLEYERHGTTP